MNTSAQTWQYRVVFVCLGNICRSPMAEAALRRLVREQGLGDVVDVASAGTGDYHIGERADERAAGALRARGYDPDGHRAAQFVAADFGAADLVVTLDRSNAVTLRRLAPDAAAARKIQLLRSYDAHSAATGDLDIPDPYYGDAGGFETALDLVEAACRGLADRLRSELVAE